VIHLSLVLDLSLPVGDSGDALVTTYRQHHLPLMQALLRAPQSATGLCINSWLLQQWISQGLEEGLDVLRQLYDFGKVELCGTASHHAIMPLVPENIAFRQVRRNSRMLQNLLHPEWKPAGFLPPQLAYGHELSRVLLPLGFRWCLADDSSYAALHGTVPVHTVTRCGGLAVLLCSRMWSQRLEQLVSEAPRTFAKRHHSELTRWLGSDGHGYQVLRLGADNFPPGGGQKLQNYLEEMQNLGVRWCHPSHLLDHFSSEEGTVPPGSCRTPVEDFWSGAFFSRWRQNPGDPAWELSQYAIEGLEQVQERLDQLLSSSTFENPSEQDLDGLRRLISGFGELLDAT